MEENEGVGKIEVLDEDFEFEVFEPDTKPHGRAIGWLSYQGKRYHFQAYLLYSPERKEVDWLVSWFAPDAPPLEKYQEIVHPLARTITLKCRELELEKRVKDPDQAETPELQKAKELIAEIKRNRGKKWLLLAGSAVIALLVWFRMRAKPKEKNSV